MVSQTSTMGHSHVPFEEFSLQVKELCEHLWNHHQIPERPDDTIDRASGRPFCSFGEKKLKSKEFTVERMRGGGFNRVVGIDVAETMSELVDRCRLILRIPRFENARPDRDVAVLRFVREYTSIPVPEVKLFDFSSNNPLKSPYVIQSRIPGDNLQHPGPTYYPYLSHKQKCTVATELGRILREIQGLEHLSPGLVEHANSKESCQSYLIRYLDLNTGSSLEAEPDLNKRLPFFQPHTYGVNPDSLKSPSIQAAEFEQSTYYFLLARFGRWRARELRTDPAMIGWWDYYERLVVMARQMNDLDLLGDGKYCLCHLDLNVAPRNIMAEIDSKESLRITGILDWDSAIFAPRFVGCAPPMWIWAWSDEGEEDEFHANDTPTTSEQRQLKTLFEDAVGPTFLQSAYRREYRLARKLFHIAIDGMGYSTDIEEVESLLAEWAEIYEIYMADELQDEEAIELDHLGVVSKCN